MINFLNHSLLRCDPVDNLLDIPIFHLALFIRDPDTLIIPQLHFWLQGNHKFEDRRFQGLNFLQLAGAVRLLFNLLEDFRINIIQVMFQGVIDDSAFPKVINDQLIGRFSRTITRNFFILRQFLGCQVFGFIEGILIGFHDQFQLMIFLLGLSDVQKNTSLHMIKGPSMATPLVRIAG